MRRPTNVVSAWLHATSLTSGRHCRTRSRRTRQVAVVATAVVALIASACTKPPSVSLSAISSSANNVVAGPTVKPGGRFDVVTYVNSSIGDDFEIAGVENGRVDGSDYESSSGGSVGSGGTRTYHIVAGDSSGSGKVIAHYCYRGCGHETKDGHMEHTDVVTFTVQ